MDQGVALPQGGNQADPWFIHFWEWVVNQHFKPTSWAFTQAQKGSVFIRNCLTRKWLLGQETRDLGLGDPLSNLDYPLHGLGSSMNERSGVLGLILINGPYSIRSLLHSQMWIRILLPYETKRSHMYITGYTGLLLNSVWGTTTLLHKLLHVYYRVIRHQIFKVQEEICSRKCNNTFLSCSQFFSSFWLWSWLTNIY